MHEVDRFAQGERLYVDYTWPFPPLAMWVMGTGAKVVGTGIHQLWALTCAIYLAIIVLFLRYVLAVLPRDLLLAGSVAALIGGFAYAQVGSAPLPLGMYAPAAPIGGLFLFLAVTSLVGLIRGNDSAVTGAVLGLSASLAVLTKQDFWVPALAVVLLALRYTPRGRWLLILATAVLPSLGGYAIVLLQLGVSDFLAMLGGFGHAAEFGDMGLPSGRRLAAEAGATSLALASLLLIARPRAIRVWLIAGMLGAAAVLAYLVEVGRPGLDLLRLDLLRREFSLFLPAIMLGWLWVARDSADPIQARLARVLLIVALAARARRGFQGIEWYHLMLELPAYALAIRALIGTRRLRAQQVAVVLLIPVSCYLLWHFGRGPLTERGRLRVEAVETTRGRILLRPNAAEDYRFAATSVNAIDPTGRRPLFAYGYSGGWNYFLSRRNPTAAPHGFHLTRVTPDSVLVQAQAAHPIVIDVSLFAQLKLPDPSAGIFRWEPPLVESHFMRVGRPFFFRLIADCEPVARHPDSDTPFLIVYDCP